jgi:GNAT superfamily N-acetyltransferase
VSGSPPAPLRTHDYAHDGDLRLVQSLAAECWRLEGPHVYMTIGDAAWQMYQHLDKLDEVRIRLWLDEDGSPRAWGWLWLPDTLVLLTHPHRRERLVEGVLDWFEETADPSGGLSIAVFETDAVSSAAVARRGYRAASEEAMNHMVRPLEAVPEPTVPSGYAVRTVRGDEDVEARTEVHRAAFAPSRVVPESYRRTMRAWPYRTDLDFDEANRIGEFEPVGTHPDHRRRGLARAVCQAGLRGLQAAGAERAIVYSAVGSPAETLYASLGFRTISRHLEFRR